MFVGPWAHKICGALGSYNHLRSWAHGALGSQCLWGVGLIKFVRPQAHKICGLMALGFRWGVGLIIFFGGLRFICWVLGS